MDNFLYSKKSIYFLTAVLVFILVALGRESYRFFEINQEIRNLENNIEKTRKENEELIKMKEYFNSKDFLEKEARLKLNVLKPGEKLIIVKHPENLEEENKNEEAKKVSNVNLWWQYFFNKK